MGACAPLFFVADRFELLCSKMPAECGGQISSYFLASIAVLVGWERASRNDRHPFESSNHILALTPHLFDEERH